MHNLLRNIDTEFGGNEEAQKEFARLGNRAPSRSSYYGIFDLAGFPKNRYYLYKSQWRPDYPMAHISTALELARACG